MVRYNAALNESEAPVAKRTPTPISSQRPAKLAAPTPLQPPTSSASARPASATGIAMMARVEGRSPSTNQAVSAITIG